MRPVVHGEVLPIPKFPENVMFSVNEAGGEGDSGAY